MLTASDRKFRKRLSSDRKFQKRLKNSILLPETSFFFLKLHFIYAAIGCCCVMNPSAADKPTKKDRPKRNIQLPKRLEGHQLY
jgi:hypothetical protein